MRVSIHEELDMPSRFGVLLHKLTHIFLGHLGSDQDQWWSSRSNLTKSSVEIESEVVAYIISRRLGLKGNSDAYLSSYLTGGDLPESVSINFIAKTAGKLEEMARRLVPAPKQKKS